MFLINPQQNTSSQNLWHILCDFDETISLTDTTDQLLETFGLAGWQDIEKQWEQGLIGSKQCMQQQIALLHMHQQAFYRCLDQIEIDQGFLDLVQLTTLHKIPLTIVSDGLDLVIHYILSKYNLAHLPIIANHLVQVNEYQWRLEFPNTDLACKSASGTCKCKIAQNHHQEHIILIGDGRSDFCLAETADYVFAKKSLVQHCKEKQILHSPFKKITEIHQPLEKFLKSDFELNSTVMVIA
ncbi:MAG: 2-hydroxy-3-keto-5-methylthiopentenyl-1-phosphate phosphatase [Acinetobacter bereziniae]|uniref:2-hydroxy-3-keto-5-methylthiopentenyl-1-phosphate phosphatase n=1 Tax=Acinetobacter bereziniae TaxID=106648 RepID=A0A833PIB9_ACIBZ|nr:MAG: 2-hydroxy-3-keto-5-methylthiopentenyl-1-phosphate phosphatase [Acinetobacter bereziniae]